MSEDSVVDATNDGVDAPDAGTEPTVEQMQAEILKLTNINKGAFKERDEAKAENVSLKADKQKQSDQELVEQEKYRSYMNPKRQKMKHLHQG